MTIHGDAGGGVQKSTRSGVPWMAIGAVVIVGALLAAGIVPRLARAKRVVAEEGAATAVPSVTVAEVKAGAKDVSLTLPATLLGLHEVGLYPRSTGYVKSFRVDIGSKVRQGERMAEIETPELDQELSVARATLEQVQATSELTRTTLDRWRSLAQSGVATKQELDERQAAFNVSRATVNAARASVDRLVALKRFAHVVAPFSGVVTSRGLDVGMLVSSTTATGSRPLFTIAQVDTLRVITSVPQDAAPNVRVGQNVDVMVQELGSVAFRGRVSRTSEAIDPNTRTLQTSIIVVNSDGRLRPGMYAQVKLTTPRTEAPLVIPANTLIIRADGSQVAVVRDGKVYMTKVTLGRDFGTQIEALSGLKAGDLLVVNPGDDVVNGVTVRVVKLRSESSTPNATTSGSGAKK